MLPSVALRRYTPDDAAVVVEAVHESLPELQPWMPWAHAAYSLEHSRAWLDVQVQAFDAKAAFEFAIVSDKGEYLGGCGLNALDTMNNRANLGYWVRSSATRRGVATAAVLAIRDWAFAHTDLIRLEILVAERNAASQRVAEKAGAFREGMLRNRLVLHGTACNATMFSLTR